MVETDMDKIAEAIALVMESEEILKSKVMDGGINRKIFVVLDERKALEIQGIFVVCMEIESYLHNKMFCKNHICFKISLDRL